MKTVRVLVNGKSYTVEVGDLSGEPLSVVVNGKTYVVEIEREAPSLQQSASNHGGPESTAVRQSAPSEPTETAAPTRVTTGTGVVTAPMPGKILAVHVTVGDRVAYGDELVVLEAMKMENLVRAQRAGVVKELRVSPGQNVRFGDVLMVME